MSLSGGARPVARVLLVNPPFLAAHGRFSRAQRSPAITKGGTLYYPMWLCYAAGVLEEAGCAVRILDAPAARLSLADICARGREFRPDLVVVDTSTPSIEADLASAEALKAATAALTVLCGPHPSVLAEETLRSCRSVDGVLRGEYDHTVRELACRIGGGARAEDLSGLAGLTLRLGDDELQHGPDRPFIEDLDALPFVSRVYRRHLRIRDYFYTITQYPQVALVSARGCPHRCVYCLYPQTMHGHRFRKRSVGNLVEELRLVEAELPEVREVFVEDDTFTLDQSRVLAFCQAYRQAGLRISWTANSRADIDRDTLEAMRAANCRLLCVGFESGDQAVLAGMRKRLRLEDAARFARDAHRAGLLVHGCFLVGTEGESRTSMERTLAFAKTLPLDTAQFFPVMVYPGTAAYDWARARGYLVSSSFRHWLTAQGLHNTVVSRPDLSDRELVTFCGRARREFYLRPGYLLYRLARLLRHPVEDGPRMWKSIRVFGRHLLRRA